MRLDDENVYTPKLNTFTASSQSDDSIFKHAHPLPPKSDYFRAKKEDPESSGSDEESPLYASSSFPDFVSGRNTLPVSVLLASNKCPPEPPSRPSGSGFETFFSPPDTPTPEGGVLTTSGRVFDSHTLGGGVVGGGVVTTSRIGSQEGDLVMPSGSFGSFLQSLDVRSLGGCVVTTSGSSTSIFPSLSTHSSGGGVVMTSGTQEGGVLPATSFDAVMAHFSSIAPQIPISLSTSETNLNQN